MPRIPNRISVWRAGFINNIFFGDFLVGFPKKNCIRQTIIRSINLLIYGSQTYCLYAWHAWKISIFFFKQSNFKTINFRGLISDEIYIWNQLQELRVHEKKHTFFVKDLPLPFTWFELWMGPDRMLGIVDVPVLCTHLSHKYSKCS